jgi:hypothetical protein
MYLFLLCAFTSFRIYSNFSFAPAFPFYFSFILYVFIPSLFPCFVLMLSIFVFGAFSQRAALALSLNVMRGVLAGRAHPDASATI